jgi:prepilin peptidase CpaA
VGSVLVLEYPLLLLFPAAMIYAAASDLFTMTIPNRISLALIMGFLGAAVLAGMGWQQILNHVGAAALVLAITIVMFSQGWLGGGDAKLLASTSLWFGFGQVLDYTLLAAILGGVLTVFILTFRFAIPPVLIAGHNWVERLHDRKTGVPYGIALAAAGLWLFPKSDIFLAYAAV